MQTYQQHTSPSGNIPLYRIPDSAKVREKMVFSGTKEAVKSAFVGISVYVNATDVDELTAEVRMPLNR